MDGVTKRLLKGNHLQSPDTKYHGEFLSNFRVRVMLKRPLKSTCLSEGSSPWTSVMTITCTDPQVQLEKGTERSSLDITNISVLRTTSTVSMW